jgi:hypothetical protein
MIVWKLQLKKTVQYLIIKIVTSGNAKKETDVKFDLYDENGIREYRLVNPIDETIYIYVLEKGKFIVQKLLTTYNKLHSPNFEKLSFEVKNIFDF